MRKSVGNQCGEIGRRELVFARDGKRCEIPRSGFRIVPRGPVLGELLVISQREAQLFSALILSGGLKPKCASRAVTNLQ